MMYDRRLRVCGALTLAWAAVAIGATSSPAAPVAHPHVGRLLGFPRERGVVPALSSPATVSARETLVRSAFAGVREAKQGPGGTRRATPVPNTEPLGRCTREAEERRSLLTQAMCYRGGPVLHDPVVHVILWQGPGTPKVGAFPAAYEETIKNYVEGLAKESGKPSNVFALGAQYFEEMEPGKLVRGEYALKFDPIKDITVDTNPAHPFPSHTAEECSDKTKFSEGPCLLDSDIRKEISEEIAAEEANGWKAEALNQVYLLLTPPGVGGCFAKGSANCAYSAYCAYHGDFGGDGMTVGKQTVYADVPYVGGVPGCDAGVHPSEPEDHGSDAAVDDISHELGEMVTDPIGSQCDEEAAKIVGCEPASWTDAIGQEIADKCQLPSVTATGPGSTYGEPWARGLGARSYNQVIAGQHYWTQRQWSNEGGGFFEETHDFEGGCGQQLLSVSFGLSAGAAAGVPTTFSASGSGAEGDAPSYWVWNFGDGEQLGSASSSVAHTYALAGEYEVAVTGYDPLGSSEGRTSRVRIGPQPPRHESTSTTSTVTTTVTKTASTDAPPARYTSSQLAAALGLPGAGAKLPGLGTITFGHGTCPPACSLSGRLYASVKVAGHRRHATRSVLIGSVALTIAHSGTGTIALKLNAAGRSLLRAKHTLTAQLQLAVTDQEGGSWQLTRPVTLTASAGRFSHRRR